ncbi:MAG: T9SS type B sorting domain-containing protein [Paludibacteraceae bacterium]|nr:T9SS type B sorting domain-containing protein [Paludibacteraceae bacterium]
MQRLLRRILFLLAGFVVSAEVYAQSAMEVEVGTSSVFTTEPCTGCTCVWYVDGQEDLSGSDRLEILWTELGDHVVSVQFEWENCYSPMTDFAVVVYEQPKEPLVPPPYFTPNGDGDSDTWEIQGIESWPDADIKIYDRFHKLLIRYKGTATGWDGTFRGHQCVSDDYWYLITFDNGRQQISGHLTLKR